MRQYRALSIVQVHYTRVAGIVPGVAANTGWSDEIAGELIPTGIDSLESRAVAYLAAGVRFAKWPLLVPTDPDFLEPTPQAFEINTSLAFRAALLLQRAGIVPVRAVRVRMLELVVIV